MRRYRIPPRLAYVVTEGQAAAAQGGLRVALFPVPDGIPVALTDTAALIWLIAAEGSDNIVHDVALGAAQSADDIRSDVVAFVEDLVSRGLLEAVGAVAADA